MAQRVVKGAIFAPEATGAQTVLCPFEPNAVILFATEQESTGSASGQTTVVGVSDGSSHRACYFHSLDAQATSDTSSADAQKAIIFPSGGEATVSFTAAGFDLNWSVATTGAWIIHYLALAVEDAYVGTLTAPTSAGTLGVSGVGFEPECVIAFGTGASTVGSHSGAALHLGFSTGPGSEAVSYIADTDNQATTSVQSLQVSKLIALGTATQATLSAFTTDGFSLSYSATGGATLTHFIALRGGKYAVQQIAEPTTVVTQIAPSAFVPAGALMMSTGLAASASLNTSSERISLAASDGVVTGGISGQSVDNAADSDTYQQTYTDRVIGFYSAGSSVSYADDINFSSQGVSVYWDTVDTTPRDIRMLIMGGNTICEDDPFFSPNAVGNGRHLISGTCLRSGDIRWRINGGAWTTETLTAGSDYWFWIDGFITGVQHRVEVEAQVGNLIDRLVDETWSWEPQVRELITDWMEIEVPTWMRSSQVAEAILTAAAQTDADIYAVLDDVVAQTRPQTATWAISAWEDMLGAPRAAHLPIAERRDALLSRRVIFEGTRSQVFNALTLVAGQAPEITDQYEDLRFDLRFSEPDPTRRALIAQSIASLKPVGIQANLSFSQFLAGVSKAGDTL